MRWAAATPFRVTAVYALVTVVVLSIQFASDDNGGSWVPSVVSACVAAAFSTPFVWSGQQRARRDTAAVIGVLTPEQEKVVFRAARTGVPPDDPALRRAALDLARY
jgi:hypothetical protein